MLTLSQLGDFLVAGLQQPMALALVLSTFPLCWLMDLVSARSRRKHEETLAVLRSVGTLNAWQRLRLRVLEWRVRELWYTQLGYVAIIVAYGWAFVGFYARAQSDSIRSGGGPKVEVWAGGDEAPLAGAGGANYVFLYDHGAGQAVVMPVEAIARLQPLPSRPTGAAPVADAEPVAPIR